MPGPEPAATAFALGVLERRQPASTALPRSGPAYATFKQRTVATTTGSGPLYMELRPITTW